MAASTAQGSTPKNGYVYPAQLPPGPGPDIPADFKALADSIEAQSGTTVLAQNGGTAWPVGGSVTSPLQTFDLVQYDPRNERVLKSGSTTLYERVAPKRTGIYIVQFTGRITVAIPAGVSFQPCLQVLDKDSQVITQSYGMLMNSTTAPVGASSVVPAFSVTAIAHVTAAPAAGLAAASIEPCYLISSGSGSVTISNCRLQVTRLPL